jgi:hypothetical protein
VSESAYTFEWRSWIYTTPFCTIGFAVNDPTYCTSAAAFPVSLNVQACASLDTFAAEIVDPVASRLFARSAFEYRHEPELPAVEAATFVVTVLQPELAAALPFPPHAATSNPAARRRTALSVMRLFVLVFISAPSEGCRGQYVVVPDDMRLCVYSPSRSRSVSV